MNNNITISSAPVTTTDLATVLQTSSHDVGTLCSHANINKWAKYKPVRYATTTKLTEVQLKSTNYGLTAWSMSSIINNVNKTFSSSTSNSTIWGTPGEWSYSKPTGGSSSPYRMGDFLNATNIQQPGYNRNAVVPANSFPEQFDITEYQIDELSIPLFTFNMKFGDASYEGVGYTGGIEIPLNDLEIMPGNPIDNGNWRVGLALMVPVTSTTKILDVVTSKGTIQQISSVGQSQAIADMLVDFNQHATVLGHLKSALAATNQSYVDVPYIPILMYNAIVASNNGTVTFPSTNTGVYCMPGGDQGIVRVSKADSTFSASLTAASIEYMNLSAGNFTFNLSGITGLRKPSAAGSSSCALSFTFTLSNNVGSINQFSSVIPGISGAFIQNPIAITYEQYKNGVWEDVSPSQMGYAGTYRVRAVDQYLGGDPTPVMSLLNRLPTYTGASGTEPGIGFQLQFKLTSGQAVIKTVGGTTLHMSE